MLHNNTTKHMECGERSLFVAVVVKVATRSCVEKWKVGKRKALVVFVKIALIFLQFYVTLRGGNIDWMSERGGVHGGYRLLTCTNYGAGFFSIL